MADKRPVHTVKHDYGWANKREGSSKVAKAYDTKKEAQAAGRDTAKKSQSTCTLQNTAPAAETGQSNGQPRHIIHQTDPATWR